MRAWDLEQGVRAFRWQLRKLELLSSMSALVLTLGYLMLMFGGGAIEGIALAGCLVVSAIVTGMIAEGGRRRRTDPIFRVLGEDSCGVVAGSTAVDVSSAFRAVVSLPQEIQKAQFLACLPSIFIVPLLLWAMGFEEWLSVERMRSLALIVCVSALTGGVLLFYWTKQCLAELRAALAFLAGDSAARGSLIRRVSFRRKLLLVVVLPAFSSALLVVDIVHENMRSSAQNQATQWATIAVESITNADAELPPAAQASRSFADALDRRLELGGTAGVIIPTTGPEVGAFRKLEDGTVLVSKALRSDFETQISAVYWAVGLVCLGVLGVAVLIGRLAAGEISDGLEALEATAERIAAGDLAPGVLYESEDELGEMGRALASVGGMVRATAARVSSTAEAAERIAEEIFAALAEVAATNVNQKDQLRQAGQVISMVVARTGEATRSATNLSSTIEESGASLLELGATGDELNETASLLTSKVSAVSESLEQMVRSVEQVAGTSERLAAASEETSSSMEEMASAMRAVDTSAETTAKLSREVVIKAELGQAKVVQTIEGMEAIREATDVAENVIRGLGARTHEIGGILDVIDDVADETNLLALNAAIIAAQAGEHGKAFSVVADEIKELADRVLASTKEIGSLIRAVQDESENAIGAIEAGSASVMSGVDLSAEAGRTLEEITVSSRESGLRIGEIVASVREQTKAASHVVGLMERVKESAEEIGAVGSQQDQGNETVYQSAMTMREVAQQVRNTTEEQAAGFSHMRENVVGVREAVDQITGSLAEQVGACRRVTEFLGIVSQGTRSNEEALEKIRGAMREFISNSVTLREDAERFQV